MLPGWEGLPRQGKGARHRAQETEALQAHALGLHAHLAGAAEPDGLSQVQSRLHE